MRKVLLVLAAVGLTTAAASATVVMEDDFELGRAQWTNVGTTTPFMATATDQAHGGVQSLKSTLVANRVYSNFGDEVGPADLKLTYWLYDTNDSTGQTRAFAQLAAYSGGGYADGTLQQFLVIGKYNSVTMPGEVYNATKYQGRIVNGTHDGGVAAGWFNLNAAGSASRSAGWHKFELLIGADGKNLKFYVDGTLGREFTQDAVQPSFDSVTLGFGTASTVNGSAWYDDVKVEIIPEPVTLILLGLGGLILRRRR